MVPENGYRRIGLWTNLQHLGEDQSERGLHDLYFRGVHDQDSEAAMEQYMNDEIPFRDLSLDLWQLWNDRGWKAQHGSVDAAQRFRDGMEQEIAEFDSALAVYRENPKEQTTRAHAISEAGDLSWLILASVSNGGYSIDDAIKDRLFFYGRYTRYGRNTAGGLKLISPPWRSVVLRASTKKGSLTTGDIDAILQGDSGFVPQLSPHMFVPDPQDHRDSEQDGSVFTLKAQIRGIAEGRNRSDLAPAAADALLGLGFVAHTVLNSTLSEVVESSVRKISGRVALGLVDKADGIRPPKLR